jgi:predicted deacetylase
VAPAWLLGEGSWRALRQFPFAYTTTARAMHLLHSGRLLSSPTMVYTARNAPGRFLSRRWNERVAARLSDAPLLRLALHPADARHPDLMRHLQRMLPGLLASRTAMTKASFVASQAP